MTALGGIKIVHGKAGTKPTDYRTVAREAGAELYFSGSIVPVFNRYAAIENLVSTRSGTVMWSTTIQFRSVDDVVGEGDHVRAQLLHGVAPPAVTAAVPGAPFAPAAPAAASATPAALSGFAVLPVTGSALDGDRQYTTRALIETLKRRGFRAVTVTSSAAIDPAADGAALCAQTAARTLIAGSLDTTSVATPGAPPPQTTAHVSLRTFDCRSHAFDLQPTVVNHIAPIANDAIRGAVEDAVSAFPSPS